MCTDLNKEKTLGAIAVTFGATSLATIDSLTKYQSKKC
jgi:hypothetical protein